MQRTLTTTQYNLRLVGTLIILGILGALVWRLAVAPAVLGDFDPADMAHRDRAFLSIGNVFTAGLMALAQFLLAKATSAATPRLARITVAASLSAFALAAIGTAGLVLSENALPLLSAYAVCTAVAWFVTGVGSWRAWGGWLGGTALLTGILYLFAAIAIFAGAFIIFVMTVAAFPLAVALIVNHRPSRVLAAAV